MVQHDEANLRSTLLQGSHHRDEHVLLWWLEQPSEQRDSSGPTDRLLVSGALAAAPKSQSPAARHLRIPLLLRTQRHPIRQAVQQLHLPETTSAFQTHFPVLELWNTAIDLSICFTLYYYYYIIVLYIVLISLRIKLEESCHVKTNLNVLLIGSRCTLWHLQWTSVTESAGCGTQSPALKLPTFI